MKAFRHTEPHAHTDEGQPRYTSFILRCRVDADGQVRVRLVDVRSGISCPIGDLDEVPATVRDLLAPVAPVAKDEA
jgi:hypothetical protein